MSKVLKDAALVVGVVAIGVATAGALAAPGSALAASLTAAAGSVGLSSASALATVLGVAAAGLSVTSQLTAKRPAQTVNPMTWQSDPEAGIPYIMGRIYVGGQIVYRQAWGSNNDHETIITAYSAGPVTAFQQLYVDGVATGYTNGGQVAILDRGKMYASVQFGAQPEAKQLGDLGPPGWTYASKLSGLAASSITFVYDAKGSVTFTTEPQVGFVVQGVTAYDPRKDDTYPGGSGPQRASDETTWTYSENPALHALSFLLGRQHNGKLVIGVGVALASILVPQYVEAANVADTNGWTISANISSTDNKWQRLKDILAAGGAEPLRLGAQIGCLVRMPRVSLATIDASEVVGAAKCQATQSRRDRLNAIVPRYMVEQSETLSVNGSLRTTVTWGIASASPVVVQDYVTFDGGQRQKQVDYGFVTKLLQAQQLARYDIEDSREFGPITLPLKLRWYGYRPGDVVTINHPQLGLNGQDVLILSRSLNPQSCTVTITARSETYAKHAFALGQTGVAPPTPGVTGPPLLPTPGATAWAIVAETISANGTTIPALVLAGSSDSPVADGIVFEYRPSVTGEDDGANWIAAGIEPAGTTGKAITGVEDGTAYQCAVSYRVGPNVGARLILGPVTAGQTSVPWSTGVNGLGKPSDNATNSADPNSPFGNSTVAATKQAILDAAAAVATAESNLAAYQSQATTRLAAIEAEARQGSPNLLLNGDFSNGLTGWTMVQANGFAVYSGDDGTFVSTNAAIAAPKQVYADVPVTAGQSYSLSLEANRYNGTSADLYLRWLDINGNDLGAGPNDVQPDGGWGQRYSCPPMQAPANTVTARIILQTGDNSTRIDATRIMLQQGPATAWRNDASQAAVRQQVTQLEGDSAAYARSLSTLIAQVAGNTPSGLSQSIAGVSDAAQAAADAAGSVSDKFTTISATLRQGSSNLLLNNDGADGFNHWSGDTSKWLTYNDALGPHFNHPATSGSQVDLIYQDVPVFPNTQYSISFEGQSDFAHDQKATADWIDGNGQNLGQAIYVGLNGNSFSSGNRFSGSAVSPANAAKLRFYYASQAGGNGDFTRGMVQQGPPTAYRDDATAVDVLAKVNQASTALANAQQSFAQLSQSVDARFSGSASTGLSTTIASNASAAASATQAVADQQSQLSTTVSGQAATLSQQATILQALNGKTTLYWSVTEDDGDGSPVKITLLKDGQQRTFEVDANLLVNGNLLVTGSVNYGALSAALVGFRGSASDSNSHSVSDSQTSGPFAVIASAGTFTSHHEIETTYSVTMAGGHTGGTVGEPDNHPFLANIQLGYRPQGGSWQVIPQGDALGGVIGSRSVSDLWRVNAGDWGLCDIGLFFTGTSGDGTGGTVSNLSYTIRVASYAN